LPGAAITSVKINGVSHEFSNIPGVKEDVIILMLNLKKIRIKMLTQEMQTLTLKVKGQQVVTAGDMDKNGALEILNPELVIANLTDKNTELTIEMTVEKGMGYVSKEVLQKSRVDIGTISLDAIFTPIRRVSYEVENMRVGDRTDFNRLKIFVETDGTITSKEALEMSIEIMINQLKSIIGFKEEEEVMIADHHSVSKTDSSKSELDAEFLKTRIESVGLTPRTQNALTNANIRTIGGLARKKERDLLEIDGLGAKGITEIRAKLAEYSITLK